MNKASSLSSLRSPPAEPSEGVHDAPQSVQGPRRVSLLSVLAPAVFFATQTEPFARVKSITTLAFPPSFRLVLMNAQKLVRNALAFTLSVGRVEFPTPAQAITRPARFLVCVESQQILPIELSGGGNPGSFPSS